MTSPSFHSLAAFQFERPGRQKATQMKKLMIAASAAMLVSGCMTNPNMGAGPTAMAMPTSASAYMRMAHSGDMFEIESSRLALQRSRNPAVRAFAQMMINDHTRMMHAMMPMGSRMGMSMASMPMDPRHMMMLQQLRSASPANFDMMYKRAQMMAHQEARMLHATYAARGDTPALRPMAARAVPTIDMHLNRARTLPGM